MSNQSNFVTVDVSPGDFLVVQQQQQEEPTATPIPPTSTAVPPSNTPIPTATPLPPTNTPIPPTSTPIPPNIHTDSADIHTDSAAENTEKFDSQRGCRRRRTELGRAGRPSGRLRNPAPPTTPGGENVADPRSGNTGSSATTYTDSTATESTRLYLPRQGNPQR